MTDTTGLTRAQRAVADEVLLLTRVLSGRMAAKRRNELSRDLMALCSDLAGMRTMLASALESEDIRLRADGTDDDLDDRWIRNLRRYEMLSHVLAAAEAVLAHSGREAA